MTDFLLPPDLGIAAATPNLDANTASFKSPTVGSTRSTERLGDALRFQFNFTTVNDDPAMKRQRGRLQAFLSSLRGQSARVWMTPPGALQRGSFPATEMFANNDLSGGTSGWTSDAQFSISALDRAVRSTRIASGAAQALTQSVARIAGIPYSLRGFIAAGKGSPSITLADGISSYGSSVSQGLLEGCFTTIAGSSPTGLFDFTATEIAGASFDAKWMSMARCAQVDNGVNLLLNSDTPGSGTGWSLNMATAATASAGGPDGALDAWKLTETATTGAHYFLQAVAVPAAAADFSYSVFVNQAGSPRGFCWVQIVETLGSTSGIAYVNLATGAVTNVSGGANIAIIGTPIAVSYGGGWWLVTITARKTNAATTIQAVTGTAQTAGTQSFAGSTSAFLVLWRASLAPSSVPVQPAQTVASALPSGTLQTGLQLNLKGLPVSSQGLLLPGDYFECGMQLNQIASPLDSDASGLGTAILTRPPRNSPADGTGFVVNNPMGRFMVTSNSTGWNEMPGRMSDASLELVEDISF